MKAILITTLALGMSTTAIGTELDDARETYSLSADSQVQIDERIIPKSVPTQVGDTLKDFWGIQVGDQ